MALLRHAPVLLLAFGLYQGFFPGVVEAASCPAASINASEVCEEVGSNDVKISANLSYVVCDNLQNLSQENWTFIVRALEFALRKGADVSPDVARVLASEVDAEELETALEEFNAKIVNSSLIPDRWKGTILRALWDERLRNEDRFNETAFVTAWFQTRLRPFLSVISTDVLQCLQNETMQCEQYQAIVEGLDVEFEKMSRSVQEDVFRSFQLPYLKGLESNGSACTEDLGSVSWLAVNFGRFSRYAKYQDFLSLNSRFSPWDVLRNLTVKQLGQLSATAGALKTLRDVETLMRFIETSTLTEYIDEFNRQGNLSLPAEIQNGLLSHVLALAQPILQEADEAGFTFWTEHRLPGLIPGMNSTLLPLLFDHLEPRNCSAVNAVVTLLNASFGEFSNITRQSIYEAILALNTNSSLPCYSTNSSFSVFLEEMFQRFADLLTLRDLKAIIPASDRRTIVNTIPPDALAKLFTREGFLNDDPFLTVVLRLYERNHLFIDRFNQENITDILPNGTKAALLAGVWPTVVSSSRNDTEVDRWLDGRLAGYFMLLDGDMLNASETLNASCMTFRKIVNKLNENVATFKGREEELYYSIKAYLTATRAKPRCYNASDPRMSGWLVMHLGGYIRYSSARDMRLLTNHNASIFQDLAFNRDNLELLYRYQVREDLAEMYADALLRVDSGFNLNSLPDQLLCFAQRSTLISNLSPDEALHFIAQVNLHCNSSSPSSSDRQLATMLVAQIQTFDSRTLVALGQQAMGLTTDQISNLTAGVLGDPMVLESLGRVTSWNRGQSQMLVDAILRNNFTLDTAEKFESLGTLAQGLPSTSFDSISAGLAIELAQKANFVHALNEGPEHLKKAFVSKILSNSSSLSAILDNVPDELVDQIPNSLLVFLGETPDLRKINEKRWSPQQAAVLFGSVLSRTDNYTELSASILQGFQCNPASRLSAGHLYSLVQEVKIKDANLDEGQLSCMARLLARSNLTANFTSYPPDVLLFFPLNEVDNANCEAFYTLASQGDLSLLANGSIQRTRLLENALRCLGVTNTSLSKEQLQQLGVFVCDMEAATIKDSDPGVLENLRLCPDLTDSQRAAFNVLLGSGKTLYGAPESWNDGTLEDLGPLAFYINRSVWDPINQQERTIFFRNVASNYGNQSAEQKEKTMFFLKAVGPKPTSPSRSKRATEDCQSSPITASTLEDPLFVINYDTAQQFDACLSNEVLKANLATLLEQPLPNDYLAVTKKKLDEIYPDGIPEDQLKLLGILSHQYSAEEISKWRVTSSDTLAALLSPDNGAWDEAPLRQLVARYLELGGNLTSPVLDLLGGNYLCYLDEDQLQQINPESIRHAEKLDISTCSQSKKDVLYRKARAAFASQEGTTAYYPLIQPYLGGAPAEDLKNLARSQVDMDINTFIDLNPEELQKLSVQDVKGLLGVNLPELKDAENDPSVATWIKRQFQSDLDMLEIGLTGGMASLSSTAAGRTVADASIAPSPSGTAGIPIETLATSGSSPTASSSHHATASPGVTWSMPAIPTDSTPLFGKTAAAEETSPSVVPTNKTAPVIDVIPRVDFPTEVATLSSGVPVTAEGTIGVTTGLPAAEGVANTTSAAQPAADSDSTVAPATTMDSTVESPSEIPATSVDITAAPNDTIGGTAVPVIATDIDTTTFDGNGTDFTTGTADSTAGPATMMDSTLEFPSEIPATSFDVTMAPNDTIGGTLIPVTDIDMTTFDGNGTDFTTGTADSTAGPATTMDSAVEFPSEIPTTSFDVTVAPNDTMGGTLIPVTATDIDTTTFDGNGTDFTTGTADSTAGPAMTMDSTVEFPSEIPTTSFDVTVAPNDTMGGTPIPVTGIDAATFDESGTDFTTGTTDGTALPPSMVDFTTEVPTNITVSPNDTMGGIPIPHPTIGIDTSTSAEITASSNTTVATDRTSLAPVVADNNVTADADATVLPTPAVYVNQTFSAEVTTTGIDNVTSPMLSVTVTSSKRPPAPPRPVPNATTPSSILGTTSRMTTNTTSVFQTTTRATATTRRASSRVPPKTRPPSRPTPNGYINVDPAFALASNASLSWVLLMLSLTIGLSVQRRFL